MLTNSITTPTHSSLPRQSIMTCTDTQASSEPNLTETHHSEFLSLHSNHVPSNGQQASIPLNKRQSSISPAKCHSLFLFATYVWIIPQLASHPSHHFARPREALLRVSQKICIFEGPKSLFSSRQFAYLSPQRTEPSRKFAYLGPMVARVETQVAPVLRMRHERTFFALNWAARRDMRPWRLTPPDFCIFDLPNLPKFLHI